METIEPWLVSPALTADRLQLIARTVVRVRARLAQLHEPEEGDNEWSFGCRAYARTCFAFEKLSLSGEHPGLVVKVDGLECRLSFDGELVTFYRGDADSPPARMLRRGIKASLNQSRLDFFNMNLAAEDAGWFWLLAIEPNEDGSVFRIVVLQADPAGEVRNPWVIPIETDVASLGLLSPMEREPVDLPPPTVGPKVEDATDADHGMAGDGADE